MTAKDKLNSSRGGNVLNEKANTLAKPVQEKKDLNTTQDKISTKPSMGTLTKPKLGGDDEGFTVNPGSKEKRALLDSKVRWMHEELKPDQVDRVKLLCE